MQPTNFHQSSSAFGDWIVVARSHDHARKTFEALGATRIERRGHVVYLWRLPVAARLLSGFAIVDGKLVLGPAAVDRAPASGLFELIDLSDPHTAVIKGDFACVRPIFYGDNLATNRLHLAWIVEQAVDHTAARSMIFSDYSFSQQLSTLATPVAGVSLMLAHQHLEVGDRVKVVTESQDHHYDILSPAAYHALIEDGAAEIRANVEAVLNSGLRVSCALTGGRDSRVVFAALSSLGAVKDVTFRTSDIGRDVEIATGLAHRFGGRYDFPDVACSARTIAERDETRRSYRMGCAHLARSWEFNPLSWSVIDPEITMGGGFGELYRGFYQGSFNAPGEMDLAFDRERLRGVLWRYSRHLLREIPGQFDRVIEGLLSTFDALPGRCLSDRLDAHYLNFRNRFHFGQALSCRNVGDYEYFPLMSESLLRAARGLPPTLRQKGRVLFDVTRALEPELAYLPYDTPWADMADDYHLASVLDGKAFTLEPRPDMIPRPKQVPVPPHERFDLREIFTGSIARDFEALKGGPYGDLVCEPVRRRIDEGIEKGGNFLAVWFSKLQALSAFAGEQGSRATST